MCFWFWIGLKKIPPTLHRTQHCVPSPVYSVFRPLCKEIKCTEYVHKSLFAYISQSSYKSKLPFSFQCWISFWKALVCTSGALPSAAPVDEDAAVILGMLSRTHHGISRLLLSTPCSLLPIVSSLFITAPRISIGKQPWWDSACWGPG